MNCREGDLAEIIYSECGNKGRRVSVGKLSHCGCCWVIQPLQPLRTAFFHGPEVVLGPETIREGVYPDNWLRPIRDLDPEAGISEGADLGEFFGGVATC
jgi:hypothetical protein